MNRLILDSGGLSRLAQPGEDSAALIKTFKKNGVWPTIVPSVVLAESTTGRQRDDANVNRLVKTCVIAEEVSERLARRAGVLRTRARRGSAVDAILVAIAEPEGAVFTSDVKDFSALAANADRVYIRRA